MSGTSENGHPDDPVARNRAAHPRRTPDREPLGDTTLRTIMKVTGAMIGLATIVLIVLTR